MKVFVVTKITHEFISMIDSEVKAVFKSKDDAERYCKNICGDTKDGSWYSTVREIPSSWSDEPTKLTDYYDIKEIVLA